MQADTVRASAKRGLLKRLKPGCLRAARLSFSGLECIRDQHSSAHSQWTDARASVRVVCARFHADRRPEGADKSRAGFFFRPRRFWGNAFARPETAAVDGLGRS